MCWHITHWFKVMFVSLRPCFLCVNNVMRYRQKHQGMYRTWLHIISSHQKICIRNIYQYINKVCHSIRRVSRTCNVQMYWDVPNIHRHSDSNVRALELSICILQNSPLLISIVVLLVFIAGVQSYCDKQLRVRSCFLKTVI